MIAAAGSGERLGAGGPKAFVSLAGRPLIEWSLLAAAAARSIDRLVIAAPAGHVAAAGECAGRAAPGLGCEVVEGGRTRAESVLAAIEACTGELVAIHDAARPLADAGLFDAVIARAGSDPGAAGAIAAAPISDTVKAADRMRGPGEADAQAAVAETVPRERLWAAQTPQVFRRVALGEAQRRAIEESRLDSATDESALLEREGGRVLIEPAPAYNIKVTSAQDLALAEALLVGLGRV